MTDQTTDEDIKLVYVRWMDHYSFSDEWISFDAVREGPDGMAIETVGFLVDEGESYYRVALSIAANAKLSGCITILKGTVVEFKECSVKAEGTESD